ncbi:SLOG family protein [Sporolactobacillus spathodeae]|uniref:Phage-like protein YoqJ n=1 Tax=Sporolactobacillus spathodeae TaxID=1465502 RepID=A0ABS2Q831_9BACL|nr:SLOG family protein [Sporolactobacillus spathodeae]MBM7657940.1 putative phage-like protein YoqJ [Sporolactobacillus spathodeae]
MAGHSFLVSGYTANELGVFAANHPGIPSILHCLKKKLRELVENGTDWFVISGQAGVELWAGQTVLTLKNEEKLPVHLAVLPPFLDQENRYKDWMKEIYYSVLEQSDFTQPISNRPYEQPLQLKQKNDFLVNKTDGLLLLYDEEAPGSPNYYLSAAKKKAARTPYPIQLINRFDLEDAAEDLRQQNPEYWAQM